MNKLVVQKYYLTFLLPFIAALMLTSPLGAQSLFERLVMPGDLIEGHADLQKDCSNCHTSFSQGAQSQLCVDCHKEVATDLKDDTGFHGKSAEVQASECSHCHSDHKGKGAIIVTLDREVFDHRQTDFALNGAHANVGCAQCHAEDKPFRQAKTTCVDCHKTDEPHSGALGNDCASCHRETRWNDTLTFDHSKTDFTLEGAHEQVTCEACHVEETYKDLPTACVDCHSIQDVHQDRFGGKCQDCHVTTKWSEVRFEHGRDTDFTLTGKHIEAGCNDCHETNVFQHDTGSTCVDCHRADDAHNETLGINCASCHSTNGWLEAGKFDHDLSRFPLLGLHVLVTCEECHSGTTFSDAKLGCQSCHQSEDIHDGNLGPTCETCHNPNGWAFWLFDHDRQTDFRLTGAHNGLKCATCHTPSRATTLNISGACISCHRNDDIHRGAFGAGCSLCHTSSSFKGARLR